MILIPELTIINALRFREFTLINSVVERFFFLLTDSYHES